MRFLTLLLFFASVLSCHAALTLLAREPFVGPGTLTAAAPGGNFAAVTGTLTEVRVGARPSTVPAPGWSADIRDTVGSAGSIAWGGQFNFAQDTNPRMLGVWVRFKSYVPTGGSDSVITLNNSNGPIYDVGVNSSGYLYVQLNQSTVTTSTFQVPLNTWVFIAFEWQFLGASHDLDYRVGAEVLGGTWNGSVLQANNVNNYSPSLNSVVVGLSTGGTPPLYRISCPSLYQMGNYTADFAYPTDIIAPVEQSYAWYVNPSTGNDNNDGFSATSAWKTAAKINLESQYCGMLDSNVAGPGNGDSLTIDTTNAPLVLGANTLTFATQGLKVQPPSTQTYIKCQAEEILSNTAFTPTSGLTHTYQTSDTQTDIVAWQNDEWMWHVESASYGASATIENRATGTSTSYPSTGAALDAVPGSFYTDGTTLYLHPFGNTNPKTDGNTYTRSINRSLGSAVNFTAGNYRALGFYVRKTCLVDSGDNDFGAYCFQDGVLSGSGFSSSEEGGYFAYGDKHCFGSTGGLTGSTLLVLNTECEQGNPYVEYGGQSPFVSYSGATTADNVHTYRGCTCLARSGLIGSTAGDPVGAGGDILLSHNNGTALSFASITLDDCNFASGSATMSAATNLIVDDQTKIGRINTSCPDTTVQQTTFPNQLVTMAPGATTLSVQNCLIKPTFALSQAPPYYGFLIFGNVTIQGCTFDLSGITGNSTDYFLQGIIQRTGSLHLLFRNNVYSVPSGENLPLLYQAAASDTLTFDHNAYNLGAGTTLIRDFSGTASANLTFSQWQSLGEDCINSTLNANLDLVSDQPGSTSPLLNAGADLGSMADVTGTVYAHRDTIGAYQGSAAYKAPQSISGYTALQTLVFTTTPVTLPATTTAGLTLTYTVLSGPATVSGDKLTLTGTGVVTLAASQAGNSSNAPLSEISTLSVNAPIADTPAMPAWALALLGLLIIAITSRSLTLRPAD